MSYNRYSYSSPLGSHSYKHSSYVSPTGNSRYSSSSSYDSTRYSSLSPGLGSSNLGGSLSSLSRPYSSLSSNRLSGDFSSISPYTPSYSSVYSPSTPSYSRSKFLSSSYTPSYVPSYTPSYTPSTSKYKSLDVDTSSSYTPRKSRATELDTSDYKPSKKASSDIDVKKTDSSATSSEARRRRREREKAAEGSSPSRPADDVAAVSKQTENLNLESKSTRSSTPGKSTSDAPKPFVPSGSPARTTEIPCGDGVATKGKSAINQQPANPDKIPVCAKCDSDIRGPFVLALNKSWCPHHFTCAKCESELVNMGFVELNGKIYCENDYETFFAPKCAKCRQAIVGDTVNALEKTWHPTCFVCQECSNPISSGAFHVEDGMPYCMNDWQRLFQTKCTGCSFPVEPGDRWIEALDANWHSECFVCGACRVKLEGKPFYPREGKPFCKDHAQG